MNVYTLIIIVLIWQAALCFQCWHTANRLDRFIKATAASRVININIDTLR